VAIGVHVVCRRQRNGMKVGAELKASWQGKAGMGMWGLLAGARGSVLCLGPERPAEILYPGLLAALVGMKKASRSALGEQIRNFAVKSLY